jgi:uncharacterized membrane protein
MAPIVMTTFWEVVAWIVIVFFWTLAIWMFIAVFADIFRRRDLSGIAKGLWVVGIFILPFLGALIYIITRPAMATAEQDMEMIAAQRRAAGFSSAEEIARAQELLTSGAITQEEFNKIKERALA